MNYTDYINVYAQNPKKLKDYLAATQKDGKITLIQDYYDGKQWDFSSGSNGETRTTRSGREMWKKFGDNPNKGFTKGELRTWNICKPAVNIYARYTRGEDKDDVKVTVRQGKTVSTEASEKAMRIFKDLNSFVTEGARTGSITSIVATKFTPLTVKGEKGQFDIKEKEVLKKIRLETDTDMLEGIVEMVDPREIEPLYWRGELRGMIRYYYISAEEAKQYANYSYKNDQLYIEVWYIAEDAEIYLDKYINARLMETGKAPYDFVPYTYEANRRRADQHRFDAHHIEESDVEEIIELQDDLNAFVSDLGVIYRQVAIPLLKITDEFIKNAKNSDIDKVKKNISKITTYAGQILFAPIERLRADGVSETQVKHIMDIREQYHTITSIPNSVFNSEGLANIAAETLEHLFESLSKVIGEKRTMLTQIIRNNVKMHLIHTGQYTKDTVIEVTFPNMFATTATQRLKTVQDFFIRDVLPLEYTLQQVLDELGDGERYDEIKTWLEQNKDQLKTGAETRLAIDAIRANAGNQQINNRDLAETNANTRNNQQNTRPA